MKTSRAQILATIGPHSGEREILRSMIEHQMDVARLNFSWGSLEERLQQIQIIREVGKEVGRNIPIVIDLPGPRVQEEAGHTYNHTAISSLTEHDKGFIQFGADQGVEYIALSFVGNAHDVEVCRKEIQVHGGNQRIISKIERSVAIEFIDEIIAASDAIMVARGDMGNEVPIEQIPFVQDMIIKKCKAAGKPVITATQMLISMVDNPVPTRAEVSDVAQAILEGSDVVMLSDETAKGAYPVEAVTVMEKIVLEAEKHMRGAPHINPL
ncbi:MAG TPA: pyruvate kinase [Candidatus Paceibacterota bacterium]|nr:pyruvate kinase [Candidatus Paceibacterota bacterium]